MEVVDFEKGDVLFFDYNRGELDEEQLVLGCWEVDTRVVDGRVGEVVGASGVVTGDQLVLRH